MKKILGIIPARYQSTRLEGKMLIQISGKEMIQRVYEQATKAQYLESVIVATDDERIKTFVESFGGNVVMTSPHHPSGTDRVAEAAKHFDTDIVMNIQGDHPFIDPKMIDEECPLENDPIKNKKLFEKFNNVINSIEDIV